MNRIWTPDSSPHIWVPRQHNIVESDDEIALGKPRVGGRARMQLRDSCGALRQDTGWFKNIIVNNALYEYMPDSTGTPDPSNAQLGSSGAAPLATDTGTGSPLSTVKGTVASSGYSYNWNGGTPYIGNQWTYRFQAGDGTGTVAELGLYNSSTANPGNFVAHALIVDGGGTPTTIVKGATQILDVTYEQRIYIPIVDVTGSLTFTGLGTFDYIVRPRDIDDTYWFWARIGRIIPPNATLYFAAHSVGLSSYLDSPGGLFPSETSPETTGAYYINKGSYSGSGTYWYEYEFQVGLDDWVGTVRTVTLSHNNYFPFQIQYDDQGNPGTGFVKTNDQIVRMRYRIEMDRYP